MKKFFISVVYQAKLTGLIRYPKIIQTSDEKEGRMLYDEHISPKKKRMRSLLSWPTAGKLVFLKVGY